MCDWVSNFTSDLVATIIGAGLGVFGALWLDRLAHRREEARAAKAQGEDQQRMLELLRQELLADRELLRRIGDATRRPLVLPPLSTALWDTLSASDYLRTVRNLPLLGSLSSCYEAIQAVLSATGRYLDYQTRTIGFHRIGEPVRSTEPFGDLTALNQLRLDWIGGATKLVDAALEEIAKVIGPVAPEAEDASARETGESSA
jgi:hypothetical protein